jgi:predicted exporter
MSWRVQIPTLLASVAATFIVVLLILLVFRGCNDLCKKNESISCCCNVAATCIAFLRWYLHCVMLTSAAAT